MKKIMLLTILTTLIVISSACSMNKSIKDALKGKSDIYKMLDYASLAGSSHNTQPWKVEVYQNDSLVIYADESRQLKVVDPKGIELYISVGAFIENLDRAANALGYQSDWTFYETSLNAGMPVASIKLKKSDSHIQSEKLKELELRTTLRIPFDTLNIKNEDRDNLIGVDSEQITFLPANSPSGRFVAKKELEAYKIQAYQKTAQEELASWIRFSNKDVNSKRDGLTPAGMGINGIAGFFVRHFFNPKDSKKESFVKSGVEKTQKQVENCGGWVLLSTNKNTISEWIKIGRIYERLNIQCRTLNLGFHPMNQIIEVKAIESELTNYLNTDHTIRFVSRIGYVNTYPAPVSKRRAVEQFAIFK